MNVGRSRAVPWRYEGSDSTVRSAAALYRGDGGSDGSGAMQIEEIASSVAGSGKGELRAMVAFHGDGERRK